MGQLQSVTFQGREVPVEDLADAFEAACERAALVATQAELVALDREMRTITLRVLQEHRRFADLDGPQVDQAIADLKAKLGRPEPRRARRRPDGRKNLRTVPAGDVGRKAARLAARGY